MIFAHWGRQQTPWWSIHTTVKATATFTLVRGIVEILMMMMMIFIMVITIIIICCFDRKQWSWNNSWRTPQSEVHPKQKHSAGHHISGKREQVKTGGERFCAAFSLKSTLYTPDISAKQLAACHVLLLHWSKSKLVLMGFFLQLQIALMPNFAWFTVNMAKELWA